MKWVILVSLFAVVSAKCYRPQEDSEAQFNLDELTPTGSEESQVTEEQTTEPPSWPVIDQEQSVTRPKLEIDVLKCGLQFIQGLTKCFTSSSLSDQQRMEGQGTKPDVITCIIDEGTKFIKCLKSGAEEIDNVAVESDLDQTLA